MLELSRRLVAPALLALSVLSLPALAAAPLGEPEFPRDWFWSTDEHRVLQDPLIGKSMPKLDVDEWFDKKQKVDFKKDTAGKVVVLDFWATWCGPCIQSIPHNNEMAEKYAKDGLVFVAICTANGQESMEKIAAEKGVKYPCVKDPKQKSSKAFQVQFFPTYVAIDRAGKVRAIGLKPDKVEDVVKKLLAEPAPTAVAK